MQEPADRKTKILLVEDDAFLVGMYVSKLDREHFQTFVASDGEKGLELARQVKPDVVLLDIILPRMDGFSVLGNLKNDPETKNIPVILLTNMGQEQDMQRGLALGAADYLLKANYMPSEVIDRVKEIVNRTSALTA